MTTYDEQGSVRHVLKVSFPIMVSQGSLSLMLFTDRYILSGVGEAEPSASMTGGFFATLISIFFSGVLTYITPLTGQFLGAKQPEKASIAFTQGLFFTGIVYPILLIGGFFLAPLYMEWTYIPGEEAQMAIDYFNLVNGGSLISLANIAMSCFLTGLKQTSWVMGINLFGMITNIPLTYYFVYQQQWSILSPVEGAALATVLSSFLMMIAFICFLVFHSSMPVYRLSKAWSLNSYVMKILLRYGSPTGGEFFLAFFAFSTFNSLFHSYGTHEALAMTITFNWDIICYLPLWGLNIGLMSLVGEAMGAKDIQLAEKITRSGTVVAFGFALFYTIVFFSLSDKMVNSMLPNTLGHDHKPVFALAQSMVQMVSLYVWANGAYMVYSASLRAAGDTKICFLFTILGDWMMLLTVFVCIRYYKLPPLTVWYIFVGFVGFISLLYTGRYYQGKWKKIEVL